MIMDIFVQNVTTGTYVKLQDAYVAEQGIKAGNWKAIGYKMVNSSNFAYCPSASACTNKTVGAEAEDETAPTAYVAHWNATSQATLNDCNGGAYWTLVTSGNTSNGGVVVYTARISDKTNCEALTPNYCKLGTANSAACAN